MNQEDSKLEASLANVLRYYLKKKRGGGERGRGERKKEKIDCLKMY
jgi:hypothetical protein